MNIGKLLLFVGIACLLLLVWLATPLLVAFVGFCFPISTVFGQVGDIYGITNALFSGLAFLGLIYTIQLQREDLQQNAVELSLSRD